MVLRFKEREEAIQLITMDPQVYGKLLTLHRRGNGVDVESLHDRSPLQQIVGKGPKMGSHEYRRLRWSKSVFVALPGVSRVKSIYRRKKYIGGATRGPQGWGRSLLPRGCLVASLTSTPSLLGCVCSKKDPREGFIPFGFRSIFLFCETLKQAKRQQYGLGLWLVGQSQK